jgi:hypothetical protein
MTLLASENVFVAIDHHVHRLAQDLLLPDADRRLRACEARDVILDRSQDDASRDSTLRDVVILARTRREPWELVAVWALIPWLGVMTGRLVRKTSVSADEIRSGLILGTILTLRTIYLDGPQLGKRLWSAVYSHAWAGERRRRLECPRPDSETAALLLLSERIRGSAKEGKTAVRERLVTAERVSSQVIDGERLGALAHRLGLSAAVQIDRAHHRWSTR